MGWPCGRRRGSPGWVSLHPPRGSIRVGPPTFPVPGDVRCLVLDVRWSCHVHVSPVQEDFKNSGLKAASSMCIPISALPLFLPVPDAARALPSASPFCWRNCCSHLRPRPSRDKFFPIQTRQLMVVVLLSPRPQ